MTLSYFDLSVITLAERYGLHTHAVYRQVDKITRGFTGKRPLPESELMKALVTIKLRMEQTVTGFNEEDYLEARKNDAAN